MKWFFRITALIILVFIGLATVGYFKSSVLIVEGDITIEAAVYDVFPLLDHLEMSSQWSPWAARNPNADFVYSQSERGVGAHVIWRDDGGGDSSVVISSQEIIVSEEPEFVQINLLLGGEPAHATYALSGNEDDTVLMYMKFERDLGGFPFLKRVFTYRENKTLNTEFEIALQKLKTLAEAET